MEDEEDVMVGAEVHVGVECAVVAGEAAVDAMAEEGAAAAAAGGEDAGE